MFQSKTCLGVDISDKDIRVVELCKSRDGYEVVQAARLEVGDGDTEAALKQFLHETSTNSSKVVWSLPTNACSVKLATLPWAKPAELARMARYEAETQIPLPLADLIWGYTAEKPPKGEDLSQVVIAAARRSVIEEQVASLEGIGLTPHGATVASLAEILSLRNTVSAYDDPVFILNIGDEWTDLTAVGKGKVLSCRSVHIGISGLAAAISHDQKISCVDARDMIAQRGVASGFDRSENVQEWIGCLSLEIRRSALASMSGSSGMSIRTAILTGDGTGVPGLAEAISSNASLAVEIGNPWSGMSISTVVAHNIRDVAGIYSVATGLALSGIDERNVINLMPGDRAEVQSGRRKDMTLLTGMGIAAVILLIVLLSGYSTVRARSEELADLQIKTSAAKSEAKEVPAELTATATVMENVLDDLENRETAPLEILTQLSASLPKSCWLTEFRYESGKQLILKGNALSNSSVADVVYMLTDTEKFVSVSPDYSNLGKNANSQVYEFQVKCQLPPNTSLAQLSKKSTKERTAAR